MKLSIGAGRVRLPGWVHLDIDPGSAPDILADITEPLPLESGSVDFAFCEEVVTQVPIEACQRFLIELRRVLKPTGCVRVLMPDLRRFLSAYFEDPEWLVRTWNGQVGIPLFVDTPAAVINAGIRMVGPFMYDQETFSLLAGRAGFAVRPVEFRASAHAELRGLDRRHPANSASTYLELDPVA
jgi:hypothetical protein